MSDSQPPESAALRSSISREVDRILSSFFSAGFVTGVVALLFVESIGVLIALLLF